MSEWKDDDEVTTTYGSIQLSLSQAHSAGIKTEQERIIAILEEDKLDVFGCGCCASSNLEELIKLITRAENE